MSARENLKCFISGISTGQLRLSDPSTRYKLLNILIIGGSGGIGAALIDQLLISRPNTHIYTTYHTRKPRFEHPNIQWFKVDASSESDVVELSNHIASLDVLINAAGFLHSPNRKPEKSVNEFNADFFHHNIESNVVPTILLSKHFSRQLKSKSKTHFISISARIGSIEDNHIGGWISYRCSKAALNMALKTISVEWKYKLPNCCVLAFHPGTTDTELSKPFQRNVSPEKLFTPRYVALRLLDLLDQKGPADTGTFVNFKGDKLPW